MRLGGPNVALRGRRKRSAHGSAVADGSRWLSSKTARHTLFSGRVRLPASYPEVWRCCCSPCCTCSRLSVTVSRAGKARNATPKLCMAAGTGGAKSARTREMRLGAWTCPPGTHSGHPFGIRTADAHSGPPSRPALEARARGMHQGVLQASSRGTQSGQAPPTWAPPSKQGGGPTGGRYFFRWAGKRSAEELRSRPRPRMEPPTCPQTSAPTVARTEGTRSGTSLAECCPSACSESVPGVPSPRGCHRLHV